MASAFCVGCGFMTRDAVFIEEGFGHWHKTPVGNHCPACVAAYEVTEIRFEPSWIVFKDQDGNELDARKFAQPGEPAAAIRRCDATLHPDAAKHYNIDPSRVTSIDIRAWKMNSVEAQTMCIVMRRVAAQVKS